MLNWGRISTPIFTILIYHFFNNFFKILSNFYEIINKIFFKILFNFYTKF